jgi:hypothetical protein
MTASVAEDRRQAATEYLYLLRSLATELERAIQSIAGNRLADLEESIVNQQILSARLGDLVQELCAPLDGEVDRCKSPVSDDLRTEINAASNALQTLNRRYAALIHHSSRSLNLMLSLFSSLRGQFHEAAGPRLKHQTWSCQV